MEQDNQKSLDELRAEVEELKAISVREAQILEQDQRELREAQERLAMRQEEKRLLDAQVVQMMGRMMMNSDVNLAEEVLKGIALIEGEAKNPDPVVEAKDKEIDELDKEFEDALGKLSGPELDEMLKRAQGEDAKLKQMVREKQADLQRLKDFKVQNGQDIARRKKDRRQKLNQLTETYNGLHAKLMMMKYGSGAKSPASQRMADGRED